MLMTLGANLNGLNRPRSITMSESFQPLPTGDDLAVGDAGPYWNTAAAGWAAPSERVAWTSLR